MRKNMFMMIAFLLCFSLLGGCGNDYEYTTYVTSTSNSMDVKLSVTPIWTQEIPEAPQEYTVEFQGKTYTATNTDSDGPSLRSYSVHQYWGDGFSFGVRADTGELASFSFLAPGFSDKEVLKQDVPNPEKTALKIAQQTASEYINTWEYTRSVSSELSVSNDDGEYTTYNIKYSKEIGGIPTDDVMYVYVTSKGTLKGVFLGEIGAFDHIRRNDISLDKAKASIEERLKEMEQKCGGEFLADDYEILEHSIHLTPEKEFAVVSLVNIWWKKPTGDMVRYLLQMTTLLQ